MPQLPLLAISELQIEFLRTTALMDGLARAAAEAERTNQAEELRMRYDDRERA